MSILNILDISIIDVLESEYEIKIKIFCVILDLFLLLYNLYFSKKLSPYCSLNFKQPEAKSKTFINEKISFTVLGNLLIRKYFSLSREL